MWIALALVAPALVLVLFFPFMWGIALVAGLIAAAAVPPALGRMAPRWKGPSAARAGAASVAFMVVFLLAGGRFYLYGEGGDLELVTADSYGPIANGSTEFVALEFAFFNNGSTTIRFNAGNYYVAFPPRLHIVAPNGTEAPGFLPIPPPLPPPATIVRDSFAELGPGEQFVASTRFLPRWGEAFIAGSFPDRGNYTVYWTYQEQTVGPSGLPCWTGHIRSANATLSII